MATTSGNQGPRYWRVARRNGLLAIEPRSQVAILAGAAIALLLAMLLTLRTFTDASVEPWMFIAVAAIGSVVVVVLAMIEKKEAQAGPWIVIQSGNVSLPREKKTFAMADCLGWSIVYRREITGVGELSIGYLALVTADQQVHTIFGSMYHKHVRELEASLATATGLPILQDIDRQ